MFKTKPIDKDAVFRQMRIVIVCEECHTEGYFYDAEGDVLCPHCIKKLVS
ncbi:hypothetical protein [Marinomonas mediterranea]|jgi:hypothetical protein|uniref:Uncharacterized protein n=1 Tax=Marinomonas mediterranea (strain ATCC 700492 / JCM 21426 / NBRC 103028 / MMB-1) TaxID=717774 RepID=F2JW09_MARM1|nr:hypothetical protein [Marinomonas mediterranea]ADZ92897.1 hypothetical protein Marme_3686 [Marinomonas mediterranea MMB-1]WCN18918.1 hypothetical protein GV053_18665 [Marinomonas mediterranea MMB-1]